MEEQVTVKLYKKMKKSFRNKLKPCVYPHVDCRVVDFRKLHKLLDTEKGGEEVKVLFFKQHTDTFTVPVCFYKVLLEKP